jgi:NADH dehydrogenase
MRVFVMGAANQAAGEHGGSRMTERIATVIGGTGFIGRRLVGALAASGYRVRAAARRPGTVDFGEFGGRVQPVQVDVLDEQSVREAVKGAAAVVNAVSLYVEKGALTFDAIHVEGAERVARCAREEGVGALLHMSGIGAVADSPSRFVRARAHGEQAVRKAFGLATIVRPSVMVARDSSLLNALERVTRLPIVPLFGQGANRLQPVWADDVAAAVASLIERDDLYGATFELGGGETHTYRELVLIAMSCLRRKRILLPVPFVLWHGLVAALRVLPNPPLTRDQLVLMQADNVVGRDARTFSELGITPRTFTQLADACLQPGRR